MGWEYVRWDGVVSMGGMTSATAVVVLGVALASLRIPYVVRAGGICVYFFGLFFAAGEGEGEGETRCVARGSGDARQEVGGVALSMGGTCAGRRWAGV